MNKMVGIDESYIQCPICKGLANTWQPYFPLHQVKTEDLAHANAMNTQNEFFNSLRTNMEPYCTFLGQLKQAHTGVAPARAKQFLLKDVQEDPFEFC